ncbi:hypothetical protein EKL02_05880 [Janthinobacterium sp. 17J80-10]|nr:hypothetical protein EKL02_05880 [Janthinobacterium sp. 17J80-10]
MDHIAALVGAIHWGGVTFHPPLRPPRIAPNRLRYCAGVRFDGNPVELGLEYKALQAKLPRMTVVGGCCGTDHRHVDAICHALQG